MASAAKASFVSIKSRSFTFQPASLRTYLDVVISPVTITFVSTPVVAQGAILLVVIPRLIAPFSLINSTTTAPSFKPEEFAVVTEPKSSNAEGNFFIASKLILVQNISHF